MKKIKIPLKLLKLDENGFHLLVEVFIFGQKYYAVLDTGASKTVFDKTAIQAHIAFEMLISTDKVSTGLGTNSMESHTLVIPCLELGKLKLMDFEVAILDLSAISHAYAMLDLPPVIGVIGGDILQQYSANIDYKLSKLTLFLPSV